MEFCSNNYPCKFFLATGKLYEEQIILKEIFNSKFNSNCIPLDDLKISETLPLIKNCDVAVCNDSSFVIYLLLSEFLQSYSWLTLHCCMEVIVQICTQ